MDEEQTELLKKILTAIEKGDVFSNLPLRGDWRWRPFDFSNVSLAISETKVLFDLQRPGWVVWGAVVLNNPGVSGVVEFETKKDSIRNSFTTNELYGMGLTNPQPNSWWNSVYNPIASVYAVQFTPATWWPFYKRFKFSLENKTTTTATITRAVILCIEILEP